MSSDLIFNLFFLLVSFGLIYPPAEFISAGFTIQNWFRNFLGSEKERFVRYHIKKSILNLLVYSCLPIIYICLLCLLGYVEELSSLYFGTVYWKIFVSSCLATPFLALYEIKRWTDNNYANHPVVVNLKKYCNNNSSWEDVAADIETEYRRLEIVSIKTNPIVDVVVTENWIVKVTPLAMFLAHQSDATVSVKEATNYQLSHVTSNEAQFLNIEVKSNRAEPFTIRINSADFKDLEDRLARSINILPQVKFHKSVKDQFLEVFRDTVKKNPLYHTNMELDQCIGCLQVRPGIKLQKQCQDAANNTNNCSNCFCRPMWCIDCIAQWFISRQDPEMQSQWLSSKCTCPMCRARFCVLDVSVISTPEE
ncbi:E3 ubiquitin-protein ligase TM129 isoform X2 [Euwallacea similis]|uniref:E3 ubiquitin-protein ligase TM129 isoform X2 n=1 Tax=Euwallacea similis TaxID=1736056 RepID=UPI0034503DF9